MKHNFYKQLLLFITSSLLLISCNDDKNENVTTFDPSFVIVNEGNFSEGNGRLFGVEEKDSIYTIMPDYFKYKNNREIQSYLQGCDISENVTVICGANGDKIEFLDSKSLVRKFDPFTTDIVNPRKAAFSDNYIFVSVWGPYTDVDNGDYSIKNSKIIKLDINTGKEVSRFDVGSKPEGLAVVNDELYVAIADSTKIEVYNLDGNLQENINLNAVPQDFLVDSDNNLWVSLTKGYIFPTPADENLGIGQVNTSSKTVELKVNFPQISGKGFMKFDENSSKIYALGSIITYDDDWNQLPAESSIIRFDINNAVSEKYMEGINFSGFGINPNNDYFYLAITPHFSGSGSYQIYNEEKELVANESAGVGPFDFIFFK
ncbi:hypothetical protein KMW28_12355 [Flammeovirga yaeyamensis]|uniref:Lipoprotein n=1 Tax=Flammeovirga yaeyamensis TaxID=367791 RepID=A0AAX1MYX5_9BACT|nr:hypothetical protein [Flammeovirga yaeyamensis]MBB3696040.1 hypothetical protein [Flammeovirga yaeyamensis]NMF34726.1 hypothetical protein [Flammeovirga yaeyamensis]QWG00445.1 hypothetical protein KMW28_12355 [Flammeovirga yaeyamensis]